MIEYVDVGWAIRLVLILFVGVFLLWGCVQEVRKELGSLFFRPDFFHIAFMSIAACCGIVAIVFAFLCVFGVFGGRFDVITLN